MDYDLTIIGAGWAGFNAAIRAKELGLKVCLIDKGPIGGTCLNLGCIPTKTLIQSAKVYSLVKKSANFGVTCENPQINFSKIQERKEKIIQQLRSGMQLTLKGIDFLNAEAKIISSQEIKAGEQTLKTKFILIACGSRPIELGSLKFDGKKIISSDEILNLKEIPKTLLIIGGGVVGSEFANLFATLGSNVSLVEKMPQLLPGVDNEVARKLETAFKKKSIKVSTNTDATLINLNNFDLVLLSIGRAPRTQSLGLEEIGVKLERGKILIDDCLKTTASNIYAAGDCTGKIMLAHFASYQGRLAAENIAQPNSARKANGGCVPSCIFTDPEIASVGLSEEEARIQNPEIKIHEFDFLGSGMARIIDETDGFIKIISDAKSGRIIGSSIIGPKATELIGILTLALSARLNLSQLQDTILAHPTLSESISDALKNNHGI